MSEAVTENLSGEEHKAEESNNNSEVKNEVKSETKNEVKNENKKLSLTADNVLMIMAYVYVGLPITIFLLGFIRFYIAIPCAVAVGFCFYRLFKNITKEKTLNLSKKDMGFFIGAAVISFVWVLISGIGAIYYQNSDHEYRNAIFELLVNYEWPVRSWINIDGVISQRGLVYYIGFWMPSAVIGKMFGLGAGYFFQVIWAALGIFLFYYLVCLFSGKVRLWPLVLFIFFSGLDIVGIFLMRYDLNGVTAITHLEWWSSYQYSSFTTQLFWVFNQAVPAWVALMLILNQKNNRYIVLILGSTLLSSTLPFVGILPIAAYAVFSRKYETIPEGKSKISVWFNDTFTIENILGGGITGLMSFVFLRSNTAAGNIVAEESATGDVTLLFYFILLEAGIFWLFALKYNVKNVLFYITLLWLIICPFVVIGSARDFCMRASIPALTMLYLYTVDAIDKSLAEKNKLIFTGLMVIIILGAVTPTHEIVRSLFYTNYGYYPIGGAYKVSVSEYDVISGYNFSAPCEDNLFYECFAKEDFSEY